MAVQSGEYPVWQQILCWVASLRCLILPGMETSLAIYEALLQANVPPPAARRVAECLEKDMTSSLATKQDLLHHEQLVVTRLDALESRFSLMIQSLESRLVFKLGALMVLLFGLASTLQRLLG